MSYRADISILIENEIRATGKDYEGSRLELIDARLELEALKKGLQFHRMDDEIADAIYDRMIEIKRSFESLVTMVERGYALGAFAMDLKNYELVLNQITMMLRGDGFDC